jgi:glutamate N-acetyltransferase / amino-acid N-acetyltransferase
VTTLPQGFTAAGITAGFKESGDPDLGLLVTDRPAVTAGVLTTNRYQAAPIQVTKRHLRRGSAKAIIANAGNANACTGSEGLAVAREMAKLTGKAIGCKEQDVLVASTGKIGWAPNKTLLKPGIEAAKLGLGNDADPFARAIMTTDTRPKIAEAAAGNASLVGIAKGAGMMAPTMATMLAFVATDASVSRSLLTEALRKAVADSFNTISLDGCMSTNDCVLVLANGAAGGEPMLPDDPGADAFTQALSDVCKALAMDIVGDGEGATKVVAITVRGATTEREARTAGRAIADSVLLRCAIGGGDPNWGRVLAALGTTTIPFDPYQVDLFWGGELVAKGGAPGPGDLDKARLATQERDVVIVVDMHRGEAQATTWTNDTTVEYVRFNSEYTT